MFENSICLEPERSRGLSNVMRGLRYGGSSSRQWVRSWYVWLSACISWFRNRNQKN